MDVVRTRPRPLRDYFSEFAFLRDRARLELDFLSALSKTGLIRPLTESELFELFVATLLILLQVGD